jgi:Zn-dependent protease
MDISPDQVGEALKWLIAFILAVTVHEFGHAWVANRLGDRTPRMQGRLTLMPTKHIDPIGTIVMPLLAAFMPGSFPFLAWGKPVQTNPANYTRLSPRVGHVLVSLAGPAMNLLMALVVSLVFIGLGRAGVLSDKLADVLVKYFLALNIMLLFFNLIPVPPLDGGAVLTNLLPDSMGAVRQALQRYGVIILFILMLSRGMGAIMRPAYRLTAVWTEALVRMVTA